MVSAEYGSLDAIKRFRLYSVNEKKHIVHLAKCIEKAHSL